MGEGDYKEFGEADMRMMGCGQYRLNMPNHKLHYGTPITKDCKLAPTEYFSFNLAALARAPKEKYSAK